MNFIRLNIIYIDYLIKNHLLLILKKIFFRKIKNKKSIKKICIFRNGSIGDSVCSLPAIYNIRKNFPESEILILYNAGSNNMVSIEFLIDTTLVQNFINYYEIPTKKLYRKLKQINIDLFIELPQVHQTFRAQIRNILFVRSLGVKHAFGWQIFATRLFAKTQDAKNIIPNIRYHFISILSKNKLIVYEENKFPLGISNNDVITVDKIIKTNKLKDNKLIGMVPGAKRKQNIWPIEYFDKIAGFLITKGYQIVIVGGKEDTNIARNMDCYSQVIDLCGKLTLLQSAEIMKRCNLVVTNDTGPMHLAYAVGTFVVAIFGSRDYKGLWYPPKENSVVFRNDEVFCKTCFSETCTDNICMKQIKPDKVISALNKIL